MSEINPYNSLLVGDMGLTIGNLPTGTPLGSNTGLPPNHPGIAMLNYLKGNLMGRPPEGQWFDRQKGEEGLYAEPEYNWELGEVDAFHGGGVFRKFSDDFIKSGTGGHVFGWGHYVSEEKGVAKYYRDLYAKERIRSDTGAMGLAERLLDSAGGNKELAIKELKKRAKVSPTVGSNAEWRKKIADAIEYVKKGKSQAAQYKVKLFKGKSPDEYTFLDWDKPVGSGRVSKIKAQAKKEGMLDEIENMGDISANADHSGEALYKTIQLGFDSKEKASKFLDRAGISGIRYPVGTLSGIKNSAKKNYVIFDPKNIDIIEGPGKNALFKPGYPKR